MYSDNDIRPAAYLHVGDRAPDFEAVTTFGDMKLSNFAGKWVVLFSHPGDFTPVCTTEYLSFAALYPYFIQRNVQLIGLSVDSLHSHLAWVYDIYRNTGVEIPFPVIADRDMKVARLYGMVSPISDDASTVRSVFIIDDKQIIRTVHQYPQTTGRWIPEIIRIIDALRTADRCKAVTPANWVPGMMVVVPPPKTYAELKERVQNPKGYSCIDWYLCMKPCEAQLPCKDVE